MVIRLLVSKDLLKGECHEIFDFRFFSWISFPPASEYPIRTISNLFENSRRYSPLKVHHRCHKFADSINDTSGIGGKFAAGVLDTGGAPWVQISPQIFDKKSDSREKNRSKKSPDTAPLMQVTLTFQHLQVGVLWPPPRSQHPPQCSRIPVGVPSLHKDKKDYV